MHCTVVGSLNMDLVAKCPRLPKGGETLSGSEFLTTPGGKGANQSVAVARLGVECSMVGRVGADSFGQELVRNLTDRGVDTSMVWVDQRVSTGVAMILVDEKGENSIVVIKGANGTLTPSDIEGLRDVFGSSSYVLTQLETPVEATMAVARLCSELGRPLILDPAPAPSAPLPADLLSMVSVLTPNQTEAQVLTGLRVETEEDARKAGRLLCSKGVKNAVVKLGEAGAVLVNGESEYYCPGIKVDVVDTTAAGDCFAGALAVGLTEGLGWEKAISFANTAAALSVTRMGAQASIPDRSEVDRHLL